MPEPTPEQVRSIDVFGLQVVAAECFAVWCRAQKISHLAVDALVEHACKGPTLSADGFVDWERDFQALPMTGLGDPIPAEVAAVVPEAVRDDFERFACEVVEVTASTWYANALEECHEHFASILRRMMRAGLPLPDLQSVAKACPATRRTPMTAEEVGSMRASLFGR